MKLQTKLSLVFLALALFPVLIVGILSFQTGQKAIRENITNHVISTNLLKMAEFERWIEDHILMLEAVAQTPFFADTFPGLITDHENGNEEHRKSHALINGQLSPILHTGGLLELFILRASDGLTLVSTDPKQDGKYLDGQPYFIHGKEDTYVQNVYFSMSIQQTAMTISTPLKDKSGETIAVLAGRLDLSALSAIMGRRTGLSRTEDTYLVNKFNFFVTEPRFGKGFALKKSVHTRGVAAALAKKKRRGFFTWIIAKNR